MWDIIIAIIAVIVAAAALFKSEDKIANWVDGVRR